MPAARPSVPVWARVRKGSRAKVAPTGMTDESACIPSAVRWQSMAFRFPSRLSTEPTRFQSTNCALCGARTRGAPSNPAIIAPPLIERMAENSRSVLPAPCDRWAEDAEAGRAGWIWVRAVSVESAMTAALLMLRKTGLRGRVGRLIDLVALCRQAPLYGERSREAIVLTWALERTLALAVSERDRLDVFAFEMLLSLLRQRRDALLPTVLAADAPGAQILSKANRSKKEARLCEEIVKLLNIGLTGFSSDKSKSPCTVSLLEKTREYSLGPRGNGHRSR